MAIAIALVLLVIGTVAFHLLNPWWFTPIASNWSQMDDTVNLTFWVTGAVFVAVNLFMAYAIVRYRHRKGAGAARGIRAGVQETRVVADRPDVGRRDRDAGAGARGLGEVRDRARGRHGRRSARPAMVVDVPAAGRGRRARRDRRVADRRRTTPSAWTPTTRADRTTCSCRAANCTCRSTSPSRCCCVRRTCCTISPCRSSASRWTSCRA